MNSRKILMLGTTIVALATSNVLSLAYAQDNDNITVTGTRRDVRSAADIPAPVDIISSEDLTASGDTDILNLLRNTVPSYNAQTKPINDAATLVRPANLRGLSSDHTLVLVNGKRRHRSAVITFLGSGLSDGSQGPDMSNIPNIALKQVEVLRDGASAQYGSDAIAGVINFVLDDSSEGFDAQFKYGAQYEGDGQSNYVAFKKGFNLSDVGYLNLAVEYRKVDGTSRSVQRTDAAGLIAAGNPYVKNPAQYWGSPDIKSDLKFSANLGIDLNEKAQFYAFGNYADREVEGGFYFRNPNTRGGVYSADGGKTRLIGDVNLTNDVTCPVITTATSDNIATAALASNPECFAFNELFPGGFTPRFGGKVNDVAGVAGLRGELDNGFSYDFSYSVGRSEIVFRIRNTVNASLGSNTPTDFTPGTYIQLDNGVNADFVYAIETPSLASPVNIAFGLEYREEQFQVVAGDPKSYEVGSYAAQGFSIGSNGFPGFTPLSAGKWDRANVSGYVDVEADITDKLILGIAARFENYDDFGSTINGKFSGLYRFTDNFRLRGTYSTGFRAPTPAQTNIINVSTTFDSGKLVNRGTVPVSSAIAKALGSPGHLSPEKSVNYTLGFGFSVANIDVTVDYFNVEVTDRIAQSSSFNVKAYPQYANAFKAFNADTVRFYVNDFDTKTSGIDIIATMPYSIGEGGGNITLAFNDTNTKVTKFSPKLIRKLRIKQIEESLPDGKGVFTVDYKKNKFSGLMRVNYYGKAWEALASAEKPDGTAALPINIDAMVTVDALVSYQVTDYARLSVGADNLLNTYPSLNPFASELGNKYASTSPAGSNGGFYYVRLDLSL